VLEVIQYKERPLGRVYEKNAIIKGINQSIIAWFPACLGSVDGVMVIFCCTQVDTKTKIGMIRLDGSGSARSSQRKPESSGAAVNMGATGIQV